MCSSDLCDNAGITTPSKCVPLLVAKGLANVMEAVYRILGKQEAPLLSSARIKFLGLNLDYSIEKAKRELGYSPTTDFTDAMRTTMSWCRDAGLT